jgi:regulatory protein
MDGQRDATQVALRYLSLRDRTEEEVRGYLRKKGVGPESAEEALVRLRTWGYLDDRRLALTWGQARMEGSHWGPCRLASALARRGVAAEVARDALVQLMQERDEEILAWGAAEKYRRSHANADGPGATRRLAAYLFRRGFSRQVIGRIVSDEAVLGDWASDPEV